MPIVTHGDLDGLVSALVVMEVYNIIPSAVRHYSYSPKRDEWWREWLGYQIKPIKTMTGNVEDVWFTDISLRPGELEWARGKRKRGIWRWVDHHKSSEEFDPDGIFDEVYLEFLDEVCAADMLWRMMDFGKPLPVLASWVEAAHDRDLWIREHPELSLRLDMMVKSQGRERKWEETLVAATHYSPRELVLLHPEWWKPEMKLYENSIKLALATKQTFPLELTARKKLPVGVCYISGFASDVCEEVYGSDKEVLVMIHPLTDVIVVNLRTRRDDVDLAELAKVFGGGGHYHAAGGRLNEKQIRGGYTAIIRDIRSWLNAQKKAKSSKR